MLKSFSSIVEYLKGNDLYISSHQDSPDILYIILPCFYEAPLFRSLSVFLFSRLSSDFYFTIGLDFIHKTLLLTIIRKNEKS